MNKGKHTSHHSTLTKSIASLFTQALEGFVAVSQKFKEVASKLPTCYNFFGSDLLKTVFLLALIFFSVMFSWILTDGLEMVSNKKHHKLNIIDPQFYQLKFLVDNSMKTDCSTLRYNM